MSFIIESADDIERLIRVVEELKVIQNKVVDECGEPLQVSLGGSGSASVKLTAHKPSEDKEPPVPPLPQQALTIVDMTQNAFTSTNFMHLPTQDHAVNNTGYWLVLRRPNGNEFLVGYVRTSTRNGNDYDVRMWSPIVAPFYNHGNVIAPEDRQNLYLRQTDNVLSGPDLTGYKLRVEFRYDTGTIVEQISWRGTTELIPFQVPDGAKTLTIFVGRPWQ